MKEEQVPIKLAIVDDHNLFRKGLIKLINLADTENKYRVIFEATNGYDLKEKLNRSNLPHIILMDIDMPDMDGYEAVKWLKETFPEISILVISMFDAEEPIIRMLRLGINGYLSKNIEVDDMHCALEAIGTKGFYYPEFVSGAMARAIQQSGPDGQIGSEAGNAGKGANDLSDNEKKFLKLACTELTYMQIAEKMDLSPKTIDGYRETLFNRFKVKSRVSLAMYAVRNGLVKL
jgi:two-component system, NarL family, invasion response regulator UvrY